MTWFKVDDGLALHPKAIEAGNAALGLWVRAGAWCASQLTDGRLPGAMLAPLGGRARDADRLVKAGLWDVVTADEEPSRRQADADEEPTGSHRVASEELGKQVRDGEPIGYQFRDWTDYQPTRVQVRAEREAAKERQRRHREQQRNGVTDGVTNSVTNGVTNTAPARPGPAPSGGLGSQSTNGRSDDRQDDGPDLNRIAKTLHSDLHWAKRVTDQVLDRAPTDVNNPTAYVLAAIRDHLEDYQPTLTPPAYRDLDLP